jgi:hypothetical protein
MGGAIAQAVSRWLPTATARVRARVWSSGICGGQSGAGAGFLRVLRFPLPIFIPPNSPSSQSPGQIFSEFSPANLHSTKFSIITITRAGFLRIFPSQSSFHQILHHHNHPGQVQEAIQWPTYQVDPVWTPPPTMRIKKINNKFYGPNYSVNCPKNVCLETLNFGTKCS